MIQLTRLQDAGRMPCPYTRLCVVWLADSLSRPKSRKVLTPRPSPPGMREKVSLST